MPSEKKKNPSLDCCTEGWNEEFISPHSYQIDYRGFLSFSFDQLQTPNVVSLKKKKEFIKEFRDLTFGNCYGFVVLKELKRATQDL